MSGAIRQGSGGPSRGLQRFGAAQNLLVKQVLSPLIIRPSHQSHDVAAGMEIERARLPHQLHVRFVRILIALAAIAGVAAGDQILPGRRTSARTRNHVIEREFTRGQY